MSAQSQEQQVDHGLVDIVHRAIRADDAWLARQAQDFNQARQANQNRHVEDNTVSIPRNNCVIDLHAAYIQALAQEQERRAARMTRSSTRVSSNSRQTRSSSNESIAPTTPIQQEIDEPFVVVTPSMYERRSPTAQHRHQEEPHPLRRSERYMNIPLLRQVMENPNISNEGKERAKEYLKNGTNLPAQWYDRYDPESGLDQPIIIYENYERRTFTILG